MILEALDKKKKKTYLRVFVALDMAGRKKKKERKKEGGGGRGEEEEKTNMAGN